MTWLLAAALAAAPPASTLERASAELTTRFLAEGFEAPVGVYVDGPSAPLGRALATVMMAKLAAAKQAPVPVLAKDAGDAEQVARGLGTGSLLRLTVSLEAPKLIVRGDALSTWVNVWSGRTPTRTGPGAAFAVSVDADLEALTFAGAAATTTSRPLELQVGVLGKLAAWPGALALADLDGDRKAEVLALVDDALLLLGADGAVRGRIALSSEPALRPTREPWGLLDVVGSRVLVHSARREKPERLAWTKDGWRSEGLAETVTSASLVLTPRPGFTSYAGDVTWAGKPLALGAPVQQVSLFGPLALLVSPEGAAQVLRGHAVATRVSGVGAATVADLDGDGSAEVVLTSAKTTGEVDEVRVVTLGAFEAAQARNGAAAEMTAAWQRKLDGRAVVAASGDLDGDGADEVVLATWRRDGSSELLVLRRVTP